MAEVRIRPRAEVDLDDATAWIASQSGRAATQFKRRADLAIARITALPEVYAPIDGCHRLCPIERSEYYFVYSYDPPTGVVEVIAVLHAKQQPRSWP